MTKKFFTKLFESPKAPFQKILPWAFISDYDSGVVVQKSGLLQKTYAFRGPDLESASPFYFNDMCVFINDIIKRLGKGWAFQFDVFRYMTRDYPGCDFDNLAAYLVDKEREIHYQSYGRHFNSSYYLTVVYEPEIEVQSKVSSLFLKTEDVESSIKESIIILLQTADDMYELLHKRMDIHPLSNQETIEYLHSQVSHSRHPIFYPEDGSPLPPFFLDRVLPDETLEVGMTLKLGELYIPMIGITGFPSKTYPAILDALNAAHIEYRWSSRFICLDKIEAIKEVKKQGDRYFGARKTWKQTFLKMFSGEETGREDQGAVVLGSQTDAAQIDLETDTVSLGLYTACLMVSDTNLKTAKKKLTYLKGLIQDAGITCKEETFNALETFKSMMSGNMSANIRRYDITSLNFAHLIPSSAIWAGDISNPVTKEWVGVDAPLMVCSTGYSTPFFCNANIGDVGNVFIAGPVGSGKSTILQLIEIQFLKYKKCRVVIIDKGKSARQLTMAVGGRYYEPGTSKIAFQPLEKLERYEDILWACEFIEGLLILQHAIITPPISKAIYNAVSLMADLQKEQRTLTTFRQTVNYIDDAGQPLISQSLDPYCLGGKYGSIFDASETNIELSQWLTLEMGSLIELGESCVTPALSYIFHFIERTFNPHEINLLVVDEGFLFFKIPFFAEKFHSWMKTKRKDHVWIILATQEVADIVDSPLCSTVTQQCQTKIFLADKEATTPVLAAYYTKLGLSEREINLLSQATPKRDYYYKSPKGTRMFQLDLGEVTLALIANQDHMMLDDLEKSHQSEKNHAYVEDILQAKEIAYEHLIGGAA